MKAARPARCQRSYPSLDALVEHSRLDLLEGAWFDQSAWLAVTRQHPMQGFEVVMRERVELSDRQVCGLRAGGRHMHAEPFKQVAVPPCSRIAGGQQLVSDEDGICPGKEAERLQFITHFRATG